MPGNMIINTASVVGYNNQLKQAQPDMKLGINDWVNKTTNKSKTTKNTATVTTAPQHTKPQHTAPQTTASRRTTQTQRITGGFTSGGDTHEDDKVAFIFGAFVIAGVACLVLRR